LIRWNFVDARRFDEYQLEWERLNSDGPSTPLLDASLMRIALRYFGDGRENLAIARCGRQLVAMALFGPRHLGALNMFQPSQLPLGPLVCQAGISLAELCDSLSADLPLGSLLASLTEIDSDIFAPNVDAKHLRTFSHIRTGFIDLPDSMSSYLSGRTKKRVYEIERRLRKAANEVGTVGFEVYKNEADVPIFLDRFADMESAGWKGKGGTAIARGNVQQKFYIDAMQSFCSGGKARMYELRFGERTAAMQLAVESDGTLYFLKTTYDEQLREYGPGVSMKQFIFEQLFSDSDCRRVEFYGRISESQRMWITGSREIFHANVYRAPVLARIHDAMRAKAAATSALAH
jgi:CelD/BcsL family acetyltransferase involved in cellulose biosynthesis